VRQIVVAPLFVSSWSDHYEQVRFLAGLRPDYPHAEHMKLARASGSVALAGVTPAMDDHALIAAILADRARALSQDPTRENLVLVAHGPNPEDEAARWSGQTLLPDDRAAEWIEAQAKRTLQQAGANGGL